MGQRPPQLGRLPGSLLHLLHLLLLTLPLPSVEAHDLGNGKLELAGVLRGDLLIALLPSLLLLLLLLDVGLQEVHGAAGSLGSGLGMTNDQTGGDRR